MVPPHLTRIAALVGPTGSGKTAATLALHGLGLPIEAINIDALQIYRQLQAGTAKPTLAERAQVPTWLIDVAEPTEPWNAARHAQLVDTAIADVAARGRWPLLVGGTGLYLRAVLRGLAEIPRVPSTVRDALAQAWLQRGAEAMHTELAQVDPDYAAVTPAQNRQRVLRALEVWQATGRPFSAFHRDHEQLPDRYPCQVVLLAPPDLPARLQARAEAMAGPLLQEVAQLLQAGLPTDAPAMQAIGYREAVQALTTGQSEATFALALARAHRHYAKKQATWFRREPIARVVHVAEELPSLAADLRAWFQAEQPLPQR